MPVESVVQEDEQDEEACSDLTQLLEDATAAADGGNSTKVSLLLALYGDEEEDGVGVGRSKLAPKALSQTRFNEMEKKVESLMDTIKHVQVGISHSSTDSATAHLRGQYYGPPGCLSETFLDACEKNLKSLKLKKSQFLVANNELCEGTRKLVEEMHVSTKDMLYMVSQSSRALKNGLPSWWDTSVGSLVCATLSQKGAPIKVSETFTKHLRYISDHLHLAAEGRKIVSSKMKQVVENAHRALVATLDDEFTTEDSYASFFQLLFDLPSLSKDYIQACNEEINVLVTASEQVAQSETEALHVVWEALTVSSPEQEAFWSEMDERTSHMKRQTTIFFEMGSTYVEDWLSVASIEASHTSKLLDWKLYKVQRIHEEVEGNREKQDMKSKILSLDSEIRMISAKLADFEDQAGRKQRLTTKKVNSLNLLKEERFRKHVQSKFASKLEILGKLLQEWQKREGGSTFDANDLSDDVRALLLNLDGCDAWVEQRTAFMHLRSVKPKGLSSRRPTIAEEAEQQATFLVCNNDSSSTGTSVGEITTMARQQQARSSKTERSRTHSSPPKSDGLSRSTFDSPGSSLRRTNSSTLPGASKTTNSHRNRGLPTAKGSSLASSLQTATREAGTNNFFLDKGHDHQGRRPAGSRTEPNSRTSKKDPKGKTGTTMTRRRRNNSPKTKDASTAASSSLRSPAPGDTPAASPKSTVTPKRLVIGGGAPAPSNPFGHVLAKTPSKDC
jgi:hypothetical protein